MKQRNTRCSFPWFNLNSNTDGSVKLCCAIYDNFHLKNNGVELNFGKDDIEKIWSASDLLEVRRQMKAGVRPSECKVCWNQEDKGIDSPRTAVNAEAWLDLSGEPTALPESLELRMGNKCNLKCMTCWPLSSSTVAEERARAVEGKLPEWIAAEWKKELGLLGRTDKNWFEGAVFERSFDKVAAGLRRLYLTGGEPTLIDENIGLLGKLKEKNNFNCFVSLTSNMTVWNEKFFDALKFFDKVEVQISLDGHGQLNDYIRFPSKFSVIDQNITRLIDEFPKAQIKIYSVVSTLNALYLRDLAEYLRAKFENRAAVWSPIMLQAPVPLSLEGAQNELLIEARERASRISTDDRGKLHMHYAVTTILNYLDHLIAAKPVPAERRRTKEFVESLDRLRNNRHPFYDEMKRLGVFDV